MVDRFNRNSGVLRQESSEKSNGSVGRVGCRKNKSTFDFNDNIYADGRLSPYSPDNSKKKQQKNDSKNVDRIFNEGGDLFFKKKGQKKIIH